MRAILFGGVLIGLTSINSGKEDARRAIKCVGGRCSPDYTVVGLDSSNLTDAELAPLSQLTNLETLFLDCEQITGRGLRHLNGLTNLHTLFLHCDHFEESSLEVLSSIPDLYSLILFSDALTDGGLETLSRHGGLTGLNLKSDQITDAGMRHFPQFERLTRLNLSSNQITDAGLGHVSHLQRLTGLTLECNQITDEGMQHLRELKSLVALSIDSSRITDGGLQYVSGLSGLRMISVSSPRVTAAGLATLSECASLEHLTIPRSVISDREHDALKHSLPTVRITLTDGEPQFSPARSWQDKAMRKILSGRLGVVQVNAVRFLSGDTVDVITYQDLPMQIRLWGIDAPELDQPFGEGAKASLEELIDGKPCWIVMHGSGNSRTKHQTLADVYVSGPVLDGLPPSIPIAYHVNATMIGKGYAWNLAAHNHPEIDGPELENEARRQRRGLWSATENPIPPWEWREMSEDERDEFQ